MLDNLSMHKYEVSVGIFAKADADWMSHLVFHYTPVHGPWLNLAEIELGVMEQQCTRRRLGDEFTFARVVRSGRAVQQCRRDDSLELSHTRCSPRLYQVLSTQKE